MRYGEKLRVLRRAKGVSQFALAVKAGITNVTVSAIEVGRVNNPWTSTTVQLAKALEISIDEFISGIDFED